MATNQQANFASLLGFVNSMLPDHMKGIDPLNPVIYECECGQCFDGATCLHCGKEYSNTHNYAERDTENLQGLYESERAILDSGIYPQDALEMKRDLNGIKHELKKRGFNPS